MLRFEVRNGYESNRLLIEFGVVSSDDFMPSWEQVVSALKAMLMSIEDLWQNDEQIWRYESPAGKFFLTQSIWNIPFIMADDFQQENSDNSVVLTVAKALEDSGLFERVGNLIE